MPDANPKLHIKHLKKSFGDKIIYTDLSLAVNPGEIMCIMGGSGTGKSVLLKHLIGLIEPDAGEILVDGRSLVGADAKLRAQIIAQFGILFQGGALFDSMSIYDNVAFGLRRKKVPEDEVRIIVGEMLERVGLPGIEHKMPSEISGGMQKRAGLARAVALRPAIMLYDEPTTGVDPITAGAVNRLIVSMRNDFRITSLVVTHDMRSAFTIADRIAMLYKGKIIFCGTPQEIRDTDHPFIRQFIEGRADGTKRVA